MLLRAVVVSSISLLLLGSPPARADDEAVTAKANVEAVQSNVAKPGRETNASRVDSTYGRIDGDLEVSLGLGAVIAPRGPRALADVRLRYLDTIGAFTTYEDGLGSTTDPRRVFAFGLEVRPLFLGRWLRGQEWGSARGDLTLDSLGLELGAFFAQPRGAPFGSRPGFQLGFGVETPVFARASGPWLAFHAAARWSDTALGGGQLDGPSDRSLLLSVTVAWHQFFGAHAVDFDDRAPH